MLYLENRHWNILQAILSKYPYHFYAYGSRVKGTARKFSDLDICYQEKIPARDITELRWELKESKLPFMVELVAWKNMNPNFQKSIQKRLNTYY